MNELWASVSRSITCHVPFTPDDIQLSLSPANRWPTKNSKRFIRRGSTGPMYGRKGVGNAQLSHVDTTVCMFSYEKNTDYDVWLAADQ